MCEKGKEAVGPLEEGEGEKIEVLSLHVPSPKKRALVVVESAFPLASSIYPHSLEIKRESPGVVVWLEMSDCWQAGNTKLYNLV